MVNEVLKICGEKGFLLDKQVLAIFEKLDLEKVKKIVDVLYSFGLGRRILTKKILDSNFDKIGDLLVFENNSKEDSENSNLKVLSGNRENFGKVELNDFVEHFKSRFNILKEILENKNLINLSSIRRIGFVNGNYSIIVAIISKRVTKNKNLILEVEDLTGSINILVNRENRDLYKLAESLMLDDIVSFRVSGSDKMLFASEIIFPDSYLDNEKFGETDEFVAFSGDFHVGSKFFLEKNLIRFIDWLNGEVGDERQKSIARKIKYLILTGDNIDGVNIYSGQEKFLRIKNCREQYSKLASLLGKIRKDVQIIMCPGQHDAVWVGEQQIKIPRKWASELYDLENLKLVENPSLVEIDDDFKILMYHGSSMNRFVDNISELRLGDGYKYSTKIVREMLKRRHLAPSHGLMDYVPDKKKDNLTIDVIPDIIVTGYQHKTEVESYNNILMVASGCWQSITPFEEKVGNKPDPCKVPLFNLKTREIKILDFNTEEIKWDESENLYCKLNGN